MTIASRLDRISPFKCYACRTPMKRATNYWPVCPKCGLNVVSSEAWAIMRAKARELPTS